MNLPQPLHLLTTTAVAALVLVLGGCDRLGAASSTDLEARLASHRNASDDSILNGRVQAALDADPDSRKFGIKLKSRSGVVFLSGSVESREQADHVIAVTRAVEGTSAVMSDIKIEPRNVVANAN